MVGDPVFSVGVLEVKDTYVVLDVEGLSSEKDPPPEDLPLFRIGDLLTGEVVEYEKNTNEVWIAIKESKCFGIMVEPQDYFDQLERGDLTDQLKVIDYKKESKCFGIMVEPQDYFDQLEKGDLIDQLKVIDYKKKYPLLQGLSSMHISDEESPDSVKEGMLERNITASGQTLDNHQGFTHGRVTQELEAATPSRNGSWGRKLLLRHICPQAPLTLLCHSLVFLDRGDVRMEKLLSHFGADEC